MVAELSTEISGNLGVPEYGNQYESPKSRPSEAEIDSALNSLTAHWEAIAGPELASHTKTLRFTGKKRRRLVVKVVASIEPPWGSWYMLTLGLERRAFTLFRAAVNRSISPHSVDHIDFVHAK